MGFRRFRLLRYFLLLIMVAIPVVTGIAAYYAAEEFHKGFFIEAGYYAQQLAENVHNHVEKEFLQPLREQGSYVDLLNDPGQLRKIEEIVDLSTYSHQVEKLYFFEPDGTISFSTVRDHIGQSMPPGNPHFQRALEGRMESVVRSRDNPLDISETTPGIELLETYVPVYSSDPQGVRRLSGVVEVYQKMSKLRDSVNRVRRHTALVALLSMGVLGALFAILTIKADRTIGQREGQILASNAALQDLSQDLERQVEERTRQLIQKEKLASLGTLAAGVAHEINNPLATVAACAEGSLNRFGEGSPGPQQLQEIKGYLELINDEVYRVKQITGNLLDFSRQRTPAPDDPLRIDPLIEQTVELMKLGEEAKGVSLELDLAAACEGLRGDPTQIRQIIHNLLANALAAARTSPEPRVLLRTRTFPRKVVLDCLDNGSGIPEEFRGRVFEPFFTTKAAQNGTGLGLTVCYSIAQRHGGTLEVVPPETRVENASWEGKVGAWIRLTLPRVDGPVVNRTLYLERRGPEDADGGLLEKERKA